MPSKVICSAEPDGENRLQPRVRLVMRIGYVVPEFPGQTHIFFWRELQALAAMEVECDLISTRLPPKNIMSHSWTHEAVSSTTYLSPLNLPQAMRAADALFRSGPSGWRRVFQAVMSADMPTLGGRLRLLGLAAAGAQIASLARRRNWNHVHIHSCADAAHVGLFARLIGDVTYSLTLHGPLTDYGPNQAMKWGNASFGIVITRTLMNEVRALLPAATLPTMAVVPMGVDTRVFARSVAYSPWVGDGKFLVFSCGRLNPCKGHDDLIRSIALLRNLGIDAQLRIAGADDARGLHHQELTQLIEELRLERAVTLLGAVSEREIRLGLQESHVFSLASLHEPLGVAIMEAMALELPVVVANSEGVRELVDDCVDGILVEPRDPAGLARGLARVANDPGLATRLAARARSKVETSFTSDQSARTLVRLLGNPDQAV
jgi:colanic acid/amylovoran biosynthesis glycosyltransferase